MPQLNLAPTKSNLLTLRRQLVFAEEGYDLLEQKRQILIFELMRHLRRAREVEHAVTLSLQPAFAALQETLLNIGCEAVDRAASTLRIPHLLQLTSRHLMGISLPGVALTIEPPGLQFDLASTSVHADLALTRFVDLLPLLAELAELQNIVLRLAHELRRTQRRSNALSKTLIPAYREAIHYITAVLEERERESFIILKMIRDRIER